MSEVDSDLVRKGFWVNHNHDLVSRMVITTDAQTGIIIIALLAVLSAIGTGHLWHLVAFAYHQYRADGECKDGLFRQQQALLRETSTPTSIMIDAIKLWWTWRNRTSKALKHTLVPFCLAILCAIGTIAASITSSFVVSSSDLEVLVRSAHCGRHKVLGEIPTAPYLDRVGNQATVYAQDCYPSFGQQSRAFSSRCRVFIQPNVPLNVSKVDCPFTDQICRSSKGRQLDALAIDSGLVDVNALFGLNLPGNERVKFRKRTTCGLLSLGNYVRVVKAVDHPLEFSEAICPGEEILLHYYTTQPFYLSLLSTNITVRPELVFGNFYYSSPTLSQLDRNNYGPIKKLQRDDADTQVVYIVKNQLHFLNKTDDPIFSSHESTNMSFGIGAVEYRMPDEQSTPIACANQYQFCAATPAGELCTGLTGQPYGVDEVAIMGMSEIQKAVVDLLSDGIYMFDMFDIAKLRLNQMVDYMGLVDTNIPDTQWITEILGWESDVWSALQIFVSDYAIGPQLRVPEQLEILKPENTGEKQLCNAQRMRKNGNFVNINVFGLIFTVVISSLAAIVDISLLKFLIYVSHFRKALAPRIERWIQDGVLQLQRRAYEAEGMSIWTKLDKDVPVTVRNEKLPDLPVESAPVSRFGTWRTEFDSRSTGMPQFALLSRDTVDASIKKPILRRSTSI